MVYEIVHFDIAKWYVYIAANYFIHKFKNAVSSQLEINLVFKHIVL